MIRNAPSPRSPLPARRKVVADHTGAAPSALSGGGAALATVVGVLIEVPAMLTVVWFVNRSKGWYEGGGTANAKPAGLTSTR